MDLTIRIKRGVVVDRIFIGREMFAVLHDTGRIIEHLDFSTGAMVRRSAQSEQVAR